jgi:hypothetical protein
MASTLTSPVNDRSTANARPRAESVGWFVWCAIVGLTSSTVGLYWDICWHMSIGRDSFWTPAHVAIQLGSILIGLSSAYLILGSTFRANGEKKESSVRIWGLTGPLGAFISVWALFLMLAAFPFDNWWHSSFGLDVKILTPPHSAIILGIFFVGLGSVVLLVGRMSYASVKASNRLNWLLMYLGALLLSHLVILSFQYLGDQTLMHSSVFYLVLGLVTPVVLVGVSRASDRRWAATKVASIYMALWLAGEWIMPLFPARPRLGPVFTPITHLIPMGFPLLLVPGAFALDYLFDRFSARGRFIQVLIAGSGFLVTMVAAQWLFSMFMISPHARNWIFGANYFGFSVHPSEYHYYWEFATVERTHTQFWVGMSIAWLATMLSTQIGVYWAEWLRKIRR